MPSFVVKREQTVSPKELVNMNRARLSNVKKVVVKPAQLGREGFGSIVLHFKRPVLTTR